jgi:hypothetical protein
VPAIPAIILELKSESKEVRSRGPREEIGSATDVDRRRPRTRDQRVPRPQRRGQSVLMKIEDSIGFLRDG